MDGASGLAVDAAGNAYIGGGTASANFPVTPGAFSTVLTGGGDAFVTKLNAAGSALIFSTLLGGSGTEGIGGLVLDPAANIYVAGGTSSTDFPMTPTAYDSTFNGAVTDAFIAKFNPGATALLYSTFLGGSDNEGAADIAIDFARSVYVTGQTMSTNFPTTPGALDRVWNGDPLIFWADAFIAKLTPVDGPGTTPVFGLATVTANPSPVTGGSSATGTVSVNAPAPRQRRCVSGEQQSQRGVGSGERDDRAGSVVRQLRDHDLPSDHQRRGYHQRELQRRHEDHNAQRSDAASFADPDEPGHESFHGDWRRKLNRGGRLIDGRLGQRLPGGALEQSPGGFGPGERDRAARLAVRSVPDHHQHGHGHNRRDHHGHCGRRHQDHDAHDQPGRSAATPASSDRDADGHRHGPQRRNGHIDARRESACGFRLPGPRRLTSGTSITLRVSNNRDAVWSGACSSGGSKQRDVRVHVERQFGGDGERAIAAAGQIPGGNR